MSKPCPPPAPTTAALHAGLHDWLHDWLRLSLEPGLRAADALRLLTALGQPEAIYRADARTLARVVAPELAQRMALPPRPDLAAAIDAAERWAEAPEHHIVTLADRAYPAMLLTSAEPPPLLYVRGQPRVLARASVAVVGARNATAGGLANARAFGRWLAGAGWCVVSGLARGIDAAAHLGALDVADPHAQVHGAGQDSGGTVAVFGTGIDRVYPAAHQSLAERIAAHGALVSELPLGAPPLPHHFPRRNRLVAGLARGVLVVEAAQRSGSLSTARLAVESGREVFAVPGSIHSPLSRGCHALIRQGAKLVETAQDIVEELRVEELGASPDAVPAAGHVADFAENATEPAVTESDPLLAALGYDPVPRDELQRRTELDDATLHARLLELELDGLVAALPGARYQRIA